MNRSLLFVVSIVALLIGVSAPPASSNHGAAHYLVACVKPPSYTYCPDWYRGVGATFRIFDPNLQSFGGHMVQSIYIGSPATGDYVELGWYQQRPTFGYGTKKLFVVVNNLGGAVEKNCGGSPGTVTSHEQTAPANGDYDFHIWKNSGENKWRFKYRQDGTSTWINLPCVWNIPAGWGRLHTNGEYAERAYVATEIWEEDSCSDEPGIFANYVRKQRFNGSTTAANADNNDHLAYPPASEDPDRGDTMFWWNHSLIGGSGTYGDSVSYYAALGQTC